MATHATQKFWLKVSAVVIGFFGAVLTFATVPATNELARLSLDILAWPIDGFPDYKSEEIRFLSALTGGFLVGWAATIWTLSSLAYDHAPEAIRRSVMFGTLAWFVFDSVGSITSGQWPNAFFNILILLAIIGPMWTQATDTTPLNGETS